jgi:zinc finger protein
VKQALSGPCPLCGEEIEYIYQTENIPFFSDILIMCGLCEACGFRLTDTMILADRGPIRYEYDVQSAEDLSTRVARSTSATIEIPELGISISPGPACQGFVSNIEGVLVRVEDAIRTTLLSADDDERRAALDGIETLAHAKDGEIPFTLIIEDPSGNSAILSDKARSAPFIPEEE